MGLGSFITAWQRQTLLLGHEKGDKYSLLIMDNRGMGDSDKPLMRYSTSEMARDVLEVVEHVGFLAQPGRRVHVLGLSMGGMIAQELALMIPERVASLSLCCTAAAVQHSGTFAERMASRTSLVMPKSVEDSVRATAAQNFTKDWLPKPDDIALPREGTPGVKMPAHGKGYRKFGSNYQRFVAQEMHKRLDPERFTLKGFLCQLVAAGWHHKSPEQLKEMADKVGRERIMVMHGKQDGMISVDHGQRLVEYINPGVSYIEDGMGHAPMYERWNWFNNTIEERFRVGEELDGR
jgi:pimeloyl-ACP methyl ester carboxylesterase